MATVKFILEASESEEEAKEMLLKALSLQASGDVHTEAFAQPGVEAVVKRMEADHAAMWKAMLAEIEAVIEGEAK